MGKWRPPEVTGKQRINEQIRITPVRVIGADGTQLGIIPTDDALRQARALELDLVEVAPAERPPVCRIMDYGKFKYQQKKRQHKGHAHQVKIKEIRVRPKTGDNDIQVKVNKAREFLAEKDKVIVTVVFRGRELAHIDEGRKVIDDVLAQLADCLEDRIAPGSPRPPHDLHAGAEIASLVTCLLTSPSCAARLGAARPSDCWCAIARRWRSGRRARRCGWRRRGGRPPKSASGCSTARCPAAFSRA